MAVFKLMCSAQLEEEIQLYWSVVLGSLSVTMMNVILYCLIFARRFEGAPGLASQFFFVTGSIKMVLGLLIFLLFQPHCPANCSREVCASAGIPNALYAFLPTFVGMIWLKKGYTFYQKAQALENGNSEGADDKVFDPVSTVELA